MFGSQTCQTCFRKLLRVDNQEKYKKTVEIRLGQSFVGKHLSWKGKEFKGINERILNTKEIGLEWGVHYTSFLGPKDRKKVTMTYVFTPHSIKHRDI